MVFGIYFFDDVGNDAVLVDDECGANSTHTCAPTHFLLAPHAECLIELQVGVGNESEGQVVLLGKPSVRGCAIFAHTYYFVSCIA